jgi:hypothetical protein
VVAPHSDIHYHWFFRVRMHVPIITLPEVRFTCEGETLHMGAGEAWIFDNWRTHGVQNPTDCERIHLVADTTGSSAFWELVARGQDPNAQVEFRPYVSGGSDTPLTEQAAPRPVMPPSEMELLLDMRTELVSEADTPEQGTRLSHYQALLLGLARDWRQLYQLYGEGTPGLPAYVKLRDAVRERSQALSAGLIMRTNRAQAHKLLEARILQSCLHGSGAP